MRSLAALVIDDEKVYDDIVSSKHAPNKKRLKTIRTKVVAAYGTYRGAAPELGGLLKVTMLQTQHNALVHAYEVRTKPMERLRSQILDEATHVVCPLCSLGEATTIDHYLPKEKYPEFAVFSPNLVPACGTCNTIKLDRILNENTGIRLFLHPYNDNIPNEIFLSVSVSLIEGGLITRFTLNKPAEIAEPVFLHLKSHFSMLRLADRYRRMALHHLGEQYYALRAAYGEAGDANRVSVELKKLGDNFTRTYGPNYWLATFYRAVANELAFCDGGFEVVKPRHA
jgi:5-methylcytosine-specific restriction endonuclease McrA